MARTIPDALRIIENSGYAGEIFAAYPQLQEGVVPFRLAAILDRLACAVCKRNLMLMKRIDALVRGLQDQIFALNHRAISAHRLKLEEDQRRRASIWGRFLRPLPSYKPPAYETESWYIDQKTELDRLKLEIITLRQTDPQHWAFGSAGLNTSLDLQALILGDSLINVE